jgi:probable HAF family extracellular repeat protein
MTDLGTLGGISSEAFAVNNLGAIVGKSAIPGGFDHACAWAGGRMTDLGVLPGDLNSEAVAVNSRGQVLVRSVGSDVHAFVWASGVRTQVHGSGVLFDPAGLNDAGTVCGTGLSSTGSYAFRWSSFGGGGAVDLGGVGGMQGTGLSITPNGVVLGNATTAGNVTRPTFWS